MQSEQTNKKQRKPRRLPVTGEPKVSRPVELPEQNEDEILGATMSPDATDAEVIAAIKAGGYIKLVNDLYVAGDKALQITKGVDTVVDLNGHTISVSGKPGVGDSVEIQNTRVTFKNGTILAAENYDLNGGVIVLFKNGHVTLENVTIDGDRSVYALSAGSSATVKSGNYSVESGAGVLYVQTPGAITVEGGVFKAAPDTKSGNNFCLNLYDTLFKNYDVKDVRDYINVKAGVFYNGFNPAEAMTEPEPFRPANFVDAGSTVGYFNPDGSEEKGESTVYIVKVNDNQWPATYSDENGKHQIIWPDKPENIKPTLTSEEISDSIFGSLIGPAKTISLNEVMSVEEPERGIDIASTYWDNGVKKEDLWKRPEE